MSTRVVVIDDDSATRVSVRWILEDADYEVLEAEDGAVALDVLHTSQNGLIVLFDYRMPRMNGVELMALAERERLLTERHVFVCMTASPHNLPPMLSALLARYGVPLLAKPFSIDELLAVIGQGAQHVAQLAAPARTPELGS